MERDRAMSTYDKADDRAVLEVARMAVDDVQHNRKIGILDKCTFYECFVCNATEWRYLKDAQVLCRVCKQELRPL